VGWEVASVAKAAPRDVSERESVSMAASLSTARLPWCWPCLWLELTKRTLAEAAKESPSVTRTTNFIDLTRDDIHQLPQPAPTLQNSPLSALRIHNGRQTDCWRMFCHWAPRHMVGRMLMTACRCSAARSCSTSQLPRVRRFLSAKMRCYRSSGKLCNMRARTLGSLTNVESQVLVSSLATAGGTVRERYTGDATAPPLPKHSETPYLFCKATTSPPSVTVTLSTRRLRTSVRLLSARNRRLLLADHPLLCIDKS
jgi:hypothetical protein